MNDQVKPVQNQPNGLLAQIKADALKAKRESVKTQLKTLYNDYNKAVDVVAGIEKAITDLLATVGENQDNIRTLLAE